MDDKDGITTNPAAQGCNLADDGDEPDTATARDEGKFLRVLATYVDQMGEANNTATGISENTVREEVATDLDRCGESRKRLAWLQAGRGLHPQCL